MFIIPVCFTSQRSKKNTRREEIDTALQWYEFFIVSVTSGVPRLLFITVSLKSPQRKQEAGAEAGADAHS